MRRIDISPPSDVLYDIVGFLYTSNDPLELGQDMLEVTFDNGLMIDAGWYPDGDPTGSYVVSVTHGAEILKQFKTTDVLVAAQTVEEWIPWFGNQWLLLGNSDYTQNDLVLV